MKKTAIMPETGGKVPMKVPEGARHLMGDELREVSRLVANPEWEERDASTVDVEIKVAEVIGKGMPVPGAIPEVWVRCTEGKVWRVPLNGAREHNGQRGLGRLEDVQPGTNLLLCLAKKTVVVCETAAFVTALAIPAPPAFPPNREIREGSDPK